MKNNKETQLIAGQYHEINLVIRNKGSSYASGVIATIKGFEKPTNVSDSQTNMLPSSFIPAVNTGNRTFNIGTMPPGSSVIIKPVIYIANSAEESVQNLILGLAYGDSYGNKQEFESSIGIIVSPMPEASNFNVIPIFENVPIFESNN